MNYRLINEWLGERGLVLEQGFVDALRMYMKTYKNNLVLLSEVYSLLSCTKADLSHWENNPCSTHLTSRNAKMRVINNAVKLFGLTREEGEALANKAGLSLAGGGYVMKEFFGKNSYHGSQNEFLRRAGVSERMFQHYMAGMAPSKQALLALAIVSEMSLEMTEHLLECYGYCLSKSLANDMVVLWFLNNRKGESGTQLLTAANLVLESMGLPLLMTKLINR